MGGGVEMYPDRDYMTEMDHDDKKDMYAQGGMSPEEEASGGRHDWEDSMDNQHPDQHP